jgi:hypothetical protein
MRFCAAVLHRVGQLLTIEDVEIAALAPGDVLERTMSPFRGWPLRRFLTEPNGRLTLDQLLARVSTKNKSIGGTPCQSC